MASPDYFHFKGFSIKQSSSVFRITTDAIAFGAWIDLKAAKRILDVGSGTGVLAFILAKRFEDVAIVALDSSSKAMQLMDENRSINPLLGQRITSVHDRFSECREKELTGFDHIISNPPYFKKSKLSSERNLPLARHALSLTISDLFRDAVELLNEGGKLTLILPAEREEEMNGLALDYGWHLSRKCNVIYKPGDEPRRVMVEWSMNNVSYVEENLLIYDHKHRFTPTYSQLTDSFFTGINKKNPV
jgi:tRNA1Val (adenine37-N6)-methyltransferase